MRLLYPCWNNTYVNYLSVLENLFVYVYCTVHGCFILGIKIINTDLNILNSISVFIFLFVIFLLLRHICYLHFATYIAHTSSNPIHNTHPSSAVPHFPSLRFTYKTISIHLTYRGLAVVCILGKRGKRGDSRRWRELAWWQYPDEQWSERRQTTNNLEGCLRRNEKFSSIFLVFLLFSSHIRCVKEVGTPAG